MNGVVVDLHAGTGSWGDAAGDLFEGFEGLFGSSQGDLLFGNAGANRIAGGDGFDYMDGREGNDTLTGGADSDTFAFHLGFGRDVVTDFAGGVDLIYLDLGDAFNTFEEVMAVAVTVNGRTTFKFDASNVLVLMGIDMTSLTADNFHFS